jgi:hypothetical protein
VGTKGNSRAVEWPGQALAPAGKQDLAEVDLGLGVAIVRKQRASLLCFEKPA